LDITQKNKYIQVVESLRSQMPPERSAFVSTMNINQMHIQNMVVNGQQTTTAAGVQTPNLAEYVEKMGQVRY
jgi:hypothetical protein